MDAFNTTNEEDIGQRIVNAILESKIHDDKVFYKGYIPIKKLQNAISSISFGIGEEDVLMIIDDTVFGNCQNGVVFSTNKLFYKAFANSAQYIDYKDIKTVAFSGGFLGSTININNNFIKMELTQIDRSSAENLANLIRNICQMVSSSSSSSGSSSNSQPLNNESLKKVSSFFSTKTSSSDYLIDKQFVINLLDEDISPSEDFIKYSEEFYGDLVSEFMSRNGLAEVYLTLAINAATKIPEECKTDKLLSKIGPVLSASAIGNQAEFCAKLVDIGKTDLAYFFNSALMQLHLLNLQRSISILLSSVIGDYSSQLSRLKGIYDILYIDNLYYPLLATALKIVHQNESLSDEEIRSESKKMIEQTRNESWFTLERINGKNIELFLGDWTKFIFDIFKSVRDTYSIDEQKIIEEQISWFVDSIGSHFRFFLGKQIIQIQKKLNE